ncbi:MAG: hypothetical protein ACTMKV_09420 [Sphingomonas parapaucimobilis]
MSDELHRRVTVTLRTLTIVATLAIGVAFGFFLKGYTRIALAAAIVVIFANVISIETLRAFVSLQSRDTRS